MEKVEETAGEKAVEKEEVEKVVADEVMEEEEKAVAV